VIATSIRRAAGPAFLAALLMLVPRPADAQGRNRHVAPVPPTLEIEVLDPNVDPLGNPAVVPVVDPEAPEEARIDIPPAVLVHRYYYTGDRSFQGPMLPGGPTILVVNHPQTGQRLYLETQMLPGAPRVIYTSHSIEYDYGPQGLIVAFGHHGKATVTVRQGKTAHAKLREAAAHAGQATGDLARRTGLPDQRRSIARGARDAAGMVADRVNDLRRAVSTPVAGLLRSTPGVRRFAGTAEQRAETSRDASVRRAGEQGQREEEFIPTNR
jgi:hypothetical protein